MGASVSAKKARVLANKLRGEGIAVSEIPAKLAEKGILSPRTGKPYTSSAISEMKNYAKRKRGQTRAQPKREVAQPSQKSCGARLAAVRSILMLREMSADERVALACLVLG